MQQNQETNMFTDTFTRLLGTILVLAAALLTAVVVGLVPPGNQATVMTALIAMIVGVVGALMVLGCFQTPPPTSAPGQSPPPTSAPGQWTEVDRQPHPEGGDVITYQRAN